MQVLAAGFRRVRRRRAATVAGTAALTLVVLAVTPALLPADREPDGKLQVGPVVATKAPSTEVASSCTPALTLPVPKGAGPIDLAAVDPTGRHIVGNGSKGQDFVPFAWNDGKVDRIQTFAASVEMFDVIATAQPARRPVRADARRAHQLRRLGHHHGRRTLPRRQTRDPGQRRRTPTWGHRRR